MAKMRLSREDTDLMREYIEEGVALNETEEQIKERRKWLADLFGCTLPQVTGAVAWKREEGKSLVLKPLELPVAAESDEPQDSEEPCIDESSDSETTDISAETDTEVIADPVTQEPETPEPKRGGAFVDYERSEIKEKWRLAEMDFYDRHLEMLGKNPEDIRVLCTPGIKSHLQIGRWLERGIRPQNITAVERDPHAWNEFASNCRELGVESKFGDLREVLPEMDERFDVVLLDFLGQYCLAHQEVIYQVPTADRAMISLNMAGKRETKVIQDSMQNVSETANGVLVGNVERRFYTAIHELAKEQKVQGYSSEEIRRRVDRIWANSMEVAHEEVGKLPVEVNSDTRDSVMWSLHHEVGLGRPDSWGFPNMCRNFPSLYSEEFRKSQFRHELNPDFLRMKSMHTAMQQFEMQIFGRFRCIASSQGPQVKQFIKRINPIGQIAGDVVQGSKKLLALERYKYISRVGGSPSPYLTDFAIIEKPTQEYSELRDSALFILTCAREWVRGQLEDTPRRFNIGFTSKGLRVNKMSYNKEFHVASISFEALERDMENYDKMMRRYSLSYAENGLPKLPERKVLT